MFKSAPISLNMYVFPAFAIPVTSIYNNELLEAVCSIKIKSFDSTPALCVERCIESIYEEVSFLPCSDW
ncbi:hypothetical protein HanXRQr2_Chr17g0821781 [Helianthus annuus]|uniref:Uncharacterized protein n=1 Tax=Helianthus annuus TaxID=4232 RepID=A0A9K3DL32_HELAN|nr:hypothetical protein HanXRQr2_Chr17g0821781 [Helianthus annuus]